MKIYINKYHVGNKLEKFYSQDYEVYSRSGLNETEKRLIGKLKELKTPQRILILENRTGVIGMIASNMFPAADIEVQNIDSYYCDKVKHNLEHNGMESIQVNCAADIDNKGYDAIFYQQTQANLVKELVFDLIQQSHKALKNHGKLYLALEKKEKLITQKMQETFGGATIDNLSEKGLTLIGKKKNKPVEYEDYAADFCFESDRYSQVKFRSYPGVFAHHRIDSGAKALLEMLEVNDGEVLYDMGCGIGSIGITAAKHKDLKKLYLVDSSSRALKACKYNCEQNGLLNYDLVLSAKGYTAPERCNVFVGNPPYFSDYRIANIFVEAGRDNLIKGGKAWFVTRNPIKLRELIRKSFGNCSEVRIHGYSILTAVR